MADGHTEVYFMLAFLSDSMFSNWIESNKLVLFQYQAKGPFLSIGVKLARAQNNLIIILS